MIKKQPKNLKYNHLEIFVVFHNFNSIEIRTILAATSLIRRRQLDMSMRFVSIFIWLKIAREHYNANHVFKIKSLPLSFYRFLGFECIAVIVFRYNGTALIARVDDPFWMNALIFHSSYLH